MSRGDPVRVARAKLYGAITRLHDLDLMGADPELITEAEAETDRLAAELAALGGDPVEVRQAVVERQADRS